MICHFLRFTSQEDLIDLVGGEAQEILLYDWVILFTNDLDDSFWLTQNSNVALVVGQGETSNIPKIACPSATHMI